MIQNSIEACSEKGEITVISELISPDFDGLVKIRIIDNGVGIRDEDLDKIFEPGFSKKRGGTGLGLAIVEKIMIEHGGKLYCNPHMKVGSEFIIELPVKNNPHVEKFDG
ncbi:ATP-binding protein [Spirochaetota bacterium]